MSNSSAKNPPRNENSLATEGDSEKPEDASQEVFDGDSSCNIDLLCKSPLDDSESSSPTRGDAEKLDKGTEMVPSLNESSATLEDENVYNEDYFTKLVVPNKKRPREDESGSSSDNSTELERPFKKRPHYYRDEHFPFPEVEKEPSEASSESSDSSSTVCEDEKGSSPDYSTELKRPNKKRPLNYSDEHSPTPEVEKEPIEASPESSDSSSTVCEDEKGSSDNFTKLKRPFKKRPLNYSDEHSPTHEVEKEPK